MVSFTSLRARKPSDAVEAVGGCAAANYSITTLIFTYEYVQTSSLRQVTDPFCPSKGDAHYQIKHFNTTLVEKSSPVEPGTFVMPYRDTIKEFCLSLSISLRVFFIQRADAFFFLLALKSVSKRPK